MSRIVEYMEEKRRHEALISVIEYLMRSDRIEDERSRGIAKKIIAEGALDNLSSKQLYRYEQDIKPLVEIACDGHCGGDVDIEDVVNAYMREVELGGIYCQSCMYDIEKYRN